jgi:hypothetical protein
MREKGQLGVLAEFPWPSDRARRALGGPKSVAGYIAVHCVGWVVPFGASKAIQVIPPSVPPSASIGRVGRNTGKSLERRDWC